MGNSQPQHHHSQYQHYPQVQQNFVFQNPPQQQILHQAPNMSNHSGPPINFYQPRPQNISEQFVRHPQQGQMRPQQMQQAHFFQQHNRMPG